MLQLCSPFLCKEFLSILKCQDFVCLVVKLFVILELIAVFNVEFDGIS